MLLPIIGVVGCVPAADTSSVPKAEDQVQQKTETPATSSFSFLDSTQFSQQEAETSALSATNSEPMSTDYGS